VPGTRVPELGSSLMPECYAQGARGGTTRSRL
jgi:hypothetical protein